MDKLGCVVITGFGEADTVEGCAPRPSSACIASRRMRSTRDTFEAEEEEEEVDDEEPRRLWWVVKGVENTAPSRCNAGDGDNVEGGLTAGDADEDVDEEDVFCFGVGFMGVTKLKGLFMAALDSKYWRCWATEICRPGVSEAPPIPNGPEGDEDEDNGAAEVESDDLKGLMLGRAE